MSEPPTNSQLLIYQSEDGRIKLDVRFEGETVWLTQQLIAELFQTTKQNIGQHLKRIFAEGELVQASVVKESFTTASDGKNYATRFYNLDAILAVGYRIKSAVATQFRIWATQRLREFIVKGFVLDDERLDGFLTINDRDILTHAGRISHELALAHAEQHYDNFHRQHLADAATQPDDFDRAVQQLPKPKAKGKKKKPGS
ncbi:MAG: RhuM family protein [Verrucomicrobia bacterium]|nr:RhuM family protein [Verrucomicrobiota bacterium]